MSEQGSGIKFEYLGSRNDENLSDLSHEFVHSEFISAEKIKEFAQRLAKRITETESEDKKIYIIDLFYYDLISVLQNKYNLKLGKENEDTKKMVESVTNSIKRAILMELKKYLDPESVFLVTKIFDRSNYGKDNYELMSGEKDYFYKEHVVKIDTDPEIKMLATGALETLKMAMEDTKHKEEPMPYIVAPVLINTELKSNLGPDQIVEKRDFTTLDELIESLKNIAASEDGEKEKREKAIIAAMIDCLRGAKFLANHGLTMTDLNTFTPGRNMGLTKDGTGIIFDFDGLLPDDTDVSNMAGPVGFDGFSHDTTLMPPEYRKKQANSKYRTNAKSMIWEFGNSFERLSDFCKETKNIKMMEQIIEFAKKMQSDKPEDRPDFDECIKALEEIINRYSTEQK